LQEKSYIDTEDMTLYEIGLKLIVLWDIARCESASHFKDAFQPFIALEVLKN
jgi:hypothetical protein